MRLRVVSTGWLGRLVLALVVVALLVLLFVFFTLALLAFGIVLVAVLVRIMWPSRKSRRSVSVSPQTIEGEYRVSTPADEPDPEKPLTSKDVTPG